MSATNFLRSASDVAFFTNFVLFRYFWLRIAPVAESRPTLPMN